MDGCAAARATGSEPRTDIFVSEGAVSRLGARRAGLEKGDEVTETVVNASGGGEEPTRRDFIHIAAGAAAVGGAVLAAWPLIDQMNPAGDTLALASIEFDLSKVTEGQQVVVKFRGK